MYKLKLVSFVLLVVLLSSCAPILATPSPAPASSNANPVVSMAVVQRVEVQLHEAEPLQANAIVRGQLPDGGCTTISAVDLVRDRNSFNITLMTTTDPLAICTLAATPFEQVVPLNIANMPEGPYVVNVNGVTTSFDPHLVPAENQEERKPIQVEHVGVQAGEGSPIPVEIVASGTWPDLCAQIAEVQSEVNDFQIDVIVLASTTSPCPPDQLGLPFRFAFPLNVVEMEAGTYTISVNGTSTTLDLPIGP